MVVLVTLVEITTIEIQYPLYVNNVFRDVNHVVLIQIVHPVNLEDSNTLILDLELFPV